MAETTSVTVRGSAEYNGKDEFGMIEAVAESNGHVSIAVPKLEPLPQGSFCVHHIDLRLSPIQANCLRRLARTLETQCVKKKSGRVITTSQAALEWLVDRLVETEKATT